MPAPDLDPDDLDRFFVLDFVPAVRQAFEEHGFAKTVRFSKSEGVTEEGQAFGGLFLIGFEGKIFEIREDFHLARPLDPFSAVGHRAQVALGALHALRGATQLSLREKATRALEAAANYSSVVRAPFHFVEI